MSDHPTTFRAEPTGDHAVEWNDRASLHRVGAGDGLLSDATALNRGTFAELVRQVMAMPAEERGGYVIEKLGDREYRAGEIAELAARPDFPG